MIKKTKNIKKLEQELTRLEKLVYRDELSGILNRAGFKEEAGKAFKAVSFGRTEIERRVGFQIPFSVIFFDLDDFKEINDTLGHKAGDDAIKTVADILNAQLRSSDTFARWAGDEFVVALIGADKNATMGVAEKLRSEIEKRKLAASFGVSVYSHQKNLDELIENADTAMYRAKKKGKDKVVLFEH